MRANPIASPCIKVCCVEPQSGICLGCYRTLPEIAGWQRLSEAERAVIMAGLDARAARLDPIYHTAAAKLTPATTEKTAP